MCTLRRMYADDENAKGRTCGKGLVATPPGSACWGARDGCNSQETFPIIYRTARRASACCSTRMCVGDLPQ